MLDNQQLRNDLNSVVARLKKRGFDFDINLYTALEDERRITQTETEDLRAKRNSLSKRIGIAKGKGEDVSAVMIEVAGLGEKGQFQ
jgi:seryl-tRNA synthetase